MIAANEMTTSFDSWQAKLHAVCGDFNCSPLPHQQDFMGHVSHRFEGGLEIAAIATNARRITHTRPESSDEQGGHCFLIVQKQGRARFIQNNITLELRPGEMILVDSARACEILPQGLIEHDSFHLSREQVARQFSNQPIPFMKLGASSASGQILHLIVNRIISGKLPGAHGSGEGKGIADALITLLPSIEQQGINSHMEFDERSNPLFYGIQQFIDQHLQDEGLCPALIASQFSISMRQLYRLFEQHDETICRYIQQRRLQRCAETLVSETHGLKTITQIAYHWGFMDSAHFSRSFKKHFGCSPREYRRMNSENVM